MSFPVFTRTSPLPGRISVSTATGSAAQAGATPAASSASTSSMAPPIAQRSTRLMRLPSLSRRQQLVDVHRLHASLDRHEPAVLDVHLIVHRREGLAGDEDGGAEILVESLHPRRQVHGIADDSVLDASGPAD